MKKLNLYKNTINKSKAKKMFRYKDKEIYCYQIKQLIQNEKKQ